MEVKKTKYGRGVFATKNYKTGETIEVSPVIVLNAEDTASIDKTLLYDYYFGWGEEGDQAAIALGNGSLFNHSFSPNARYIKDLLSYKIEFEALKPIKNGDEILVNYNGDPKSKKPLWFIADPEY